MNDGFSLQPYEGMPAIYFQTSPPPIFSSSPDWYLNFEYIRERERGYEWREDLFTPGELTVPLERGKPVVLSASLLPCRRKTDRSLDGESNRREAGKRRKTSLSWSRATRGTVRPCTPFSGQDGSS